MFVRSSVWPKPERNHCYKSIQQRRLNFQKDAYKGKQSFKLLGKCKDAPSTGTLTSPGSQ
ncbi:hypothetical protein POKO110462_01430 [Pontibacter korlensis]|uniref:Uncharacterized protein n=1 Tax=Pontibacter korlensis TaxID=400092 RepID=A0A0E3ZEC9_9BACT|nr:hypothetical protein PKOR_06915 [Pontibacter korlensis]